MLIVCLAEDPLRGCRDHWDYLLTNFKPDKLYIIGEKKGEDSKTFDVAIHIDTAESLPTDVPLVVFAPKNGRYYQGDIDIYDFEHPEDAIYLFGSDNLHLSSDQMGERQPDYTVYIDTDNHVEMYSSNAAAIAFYDRRIDKNG